MQGTIERANSAAHLNNKKAIVSEGSRQENSTHARNLVQGTRGGRKAERAPGGQRGQPEIGSSGKPLPALGLETQRQKERYEAQM